MEWWWQLQQVIGHIIYYYVDVFHGFSKGHVTCHIHLNMEGHVTFQLLLPHPPDYGRTCYISLPAAASSWLWKDMLHFPSSYHIHLIIEGQVTFPLLLPHPPDYGRTCCISTSAATFFLLKPLEIEFDSEAAPTCFLPLEYDQCQNLYPRTYLIE